MTDDGRRNNARALAEQLFAKGTKPESVKRNERRKKNRGGRLVLNGVEIMDKEETAYVFVKMGLLDAGDTQNPAKIRDAVSSLVYRITHEREHHYDNPTERWLPTYVPGARRTGLLDREIVPNDAVWQIVRPPGYPARKIGSRGDPIQRGHLNLDHYRDTKSVNQADTVKPIQQIKAPQLTAMITKLFGKLEEPSDNPHFNVMAEGQFDAMLDSADLEDEVAWTRPTPKAPTEEPTEE